MKPHGNVDWDSRFMAIAEQVSAWSKDRSRRVGCVIVGPENELRSTGYNGFPRGVDDDAQYRHDRPMKYKWTEHAERNAIYNAARIGTPLAGCRLYVTWLPCMDCARAVVQAGMSELVCVEKDLDDPLWAVDFREVPILLLEAGVRLRYWRPSTSIAG
jgi:dCMP deaminase